MGFVVIPRWDEAIDPVRTDREKYRDSGWDPKHLTLHDGRTPTRYHCRRLRASEMRAVQAHTSEPERLWAAFARGVESVDGMRTKERATWARTDKDRPISDAEIDTVFGGVYAEIEEVGAAIYGRSLLGEGRPAAWPQPATSRYAVEAVVFRHAAEMHEQAAASLRNKRRAAEPPPTTPESSPSGERCGDATATASSDVPSTSLAEREEASAATSE